MLHFLNNLAVVGPPAVPLLAGAGVGLILGIALCASGLSRLNSSAANHFATNLAVLTILAAIASLLVAAGLTYEVFSAAVCGVPAEC